MKNNEIMAKKIMKENNDVMNNNEWKWNNEK